MVSKLKFSLILSILVGLFGIMNISFIILGLLNIFPIYITERLNGFSFVTSPGLFLVAAINCVLLGIYSLRKKNPTDFSNLKLIIILNIIGLLPFLLFILIISYWGF